jgi:hypothetical protein
MLFRNLIEASNSVDKLPSTDRVNQQEVEYIYDDKTKKFASMSTLYSTSSEGIAGFLANKMAKVNSFIRDHFMDGMDLFSFDINNVTSLHVNDNVYINEYIKLLDKVNDYIKTNHIKPDKLSKLYYNELRSELVGITRGFKGVLISVTNNNILYPAYTQTDDLLSKLFPVLSKVNDTIYELSNKVAANPYKEITALKTFKNNNITSALTSYKNIKSTYDKYINSLIDGRSNKDYVQVQSIVKMSNPDISIWEDNKIFTNFVNSIEKSYYSVAVLRKGSVKTNEINRFNSLARTVRSNIDIIIKDPKVQAYIKTNEHKTRYLELMEITEAFAKLNTMFASLLYTLNQIIIIQTNFLTNQYVKLAKLSKGSYI